jgi:hypothetical protein
LFLSVSQKLNRFVHPHRRDEIGQRSVGLLVEGAVERGSARGWLFG